MSHGLNKIMVIGHLGHDPEMRYTPAGKPVTTFSVAVNRSWESSDGTRQNQTEWFNVLAWGKLAEFCKQSLSKGKQVYVEGRLQTRQWTGQDGQQRQATEIVIEDMLILDSNGPRPTTPMPSDVTMTPVQQPTAEEVAEDIPF